MQSDGVLQSFGGSFHGSEKRFDEAKGFHLTELDDIMLTHNLLSGCTSVTDDKGCDGSAFQPRRTFQKRFVLRRNPGDKAAGAGKGA